MSTEKEIERQQKLAEQWHIPLLTRKFWTLSKARDSMEEFRLEQEDVPLIIKLVENPKYDVGLFTGNVSLHSHDCIHILLGRGVLVKDEAFVIGYTMGSTKKMRRWRRNLFMFCSKYLYPEGYKFKEEERFIFNMGVMAGSRCKTDLSVVDFKKFGDYKIQALREKLGVHKKSLIHCYEVEKRCFPESPECQRLL